ncbi:poly(ethylene terephthalate) hydrolase family protein [Psychrobacter aquimaris]|uniref:poly(ethylene terephthalate) hydrolase family protein n=1 Tax=Psychrobacter aquimaris TaxID=292733 RepID=UPI003FD4CC6F
MIKTTAKWTRPLYSLLARMTALPYHKKYSSPFYDKATGAKMKIEIKNGSHFCPSYRFNEILLSKPSIAWMHRYINGDTRFDKFLCRNDNYGNNPRISAYDYKNC